jgi:hypothetical protein
MSRASQLSPYLIFSKVRIRLPDGIYKDMGRAVEICDDENRRAVMLGFAADEYGDGAQMSAGAGR